MAIRPNLMSVSLCFVNDVKPIFSRVLTGLSKYLCFLALLSAPSVPLSQRHPLVHWKSEYFTVSPQRFLLRGGCESREAEK